MVHLTPRPLHADDPVQAHIARVYAEFGLEFDLDFEDDLQDAVGSDRTGAFGVVEGPPGSTSRIWATAGVLPHGSTRIIKRIYVAAEARRLGLARQLLRLAAAWGDFPRTELWSDVRFRSAHRLYLSEGFQPGPVRVLEDPDRSVERSFWR